MKTLKQENIKQQTEVKMETDKRKQEHLCTSCYHEKPRSHGEKRCGYCAKPIPQTEVYDVLLCDACAEHLGVCKICTETMD